MNSDFISIGQASKILGISIQTLRNWEKTGKLLPDFISVGRTRRYSRCRLLSIAGLTKPETKEDQKTTIAYARVSTNEQKEDLSRQIELLELFCAKNGFSYEVISDLGSGMNYRKKGLKKLLDALLNDKVERLVITHKDRLLRFGAELVFTICETKGVEVIILNKGDGAVGFEEELAKDVLEIITVFSAKLYGSRSKKNRELLKKINRNRKGSALGL